MSISWFSAIAADFSDTNIIFFKGNWCKERVCGTREVKIDSVVVHSFEVESEEENIPAYETKDHAFAKSGSCAQILKNWEQAKIGAHYIVTSESAEKFLADLESKLPDLKKREEENRFGKIVHNPKNIALICCIPDHYAAFHAGNSHFKNFGTVDGARCTLNLNSIGIEVQGNGSFKGDETVHNFDRFWPEQITLCAQLIQFLCKKHSLDPKEAVLAHSTIAPLRKKDPGRYFPFKELSEKGIGWVLTKPKHKEKLTENVPVDEVRALLMKIGYSLSKDVYPGVGVDFGGEEKFGCLAAKSTRDMTMGTLDSWALQYAPWAWEQESEGAKQLSEHSRGQVVVALRQHRE